MAEWRSGAIALAICGSKCDIAVAHVPHSLRPEERQTLLEDQAYRLRLAISAPVSVVDINRVPSPLAYNITDQCEVLLCRFDFRLRAEQLRVWSLWAGCKAKHERYRKAL